MRGNKEKEPQTLEQIEDGAKIRVHESPGFLYTLQMNAKVEHSPDDVYALLIDANANCFRSIKSCTYRKHLQDDGQRRKLEVGHKALARFLFISVTFETRLLVEEDDVNRTIRFQNAKQGFMKAFDGMWHVRPFTQKSLDEASTLETTRAGSHHQQQAQKGPAWLNPAGLMGALQRLAPQQQHASSLVTLEQSILPSMPAPGPVKHLIRGLCAKQLKDLMEDLNKELDRRAKVKSKPGAEPSGSKAVAQGKGSKALGTAAAAASITVAGQTREIWSSMEPLINITIQL